MGRTAHCPARKRDLPSLALGDANRGVFDALRGAIGRARRTDPPSGGLFHFRAALARVEPAPYNLSAQGPIIPINAPLLALTPISPFRPRRWRGALLPDRATVGIDVLEAEKRPVAAVADHDEVRDVRSVQISMDRGISIPMLFDPGHSLDERILREQFGH